MRSVLKLVAALALLPTLAQAMPVRYDFDLTITQKIVAGGYPTPRPSDPLYDQYYLGQQLHGSFIFDYEKSLALSHYDPLSTGVYRPGTSYWVDMGTGLVYGEPDYALSGLQLQNSAPGEGMDRIMMFDETPKYIGMLGAPGGYIEDFYFWRDDPSGTMLDSLDASAIDWSWLNGGSWYYWWEGEQSGHASLRLSGTVENFRRVDVPEPGMLSLFVLGLLGCLAGRRKQLST